MRVLVIGATGFIGAYIVAKLLKENIKVIAAVRDVDNFKLKFPDIEVIHCDLNLAIEANYWQDKLNDINIVINVAGLLTSTANNDIHNVHIKGPQALFDACVKAKVKRIIHISALGIEDQKTTDYALTKKAADNYLVNLKGINDWVILQPSLVYAVGCYGGTSLLRSLASLPYFIPLIGNGLQQFQPIHMDDLTETVALCVARKDKIKRIIRLVGPEIVTVKDILINFRKWLGLKPAKLIKIPHTVIKVFAKIGDLFGCGPLNSTSYQMMIHPNVYDQQEFVSFTGFQPRSFTQGLATEPLTIQSLWHARLYFLKPVIKITLGMFWIATGVITGIVAPELGLKTIMGLGFSKVIANILLYITCIFDILLGILLILKRKISLICTIQILAMIAYSLSLTILKPTLWLDPLGPLTKNIPIIMLTLIMLAVEKDK